MTTDMTLIRDNYRVDWCFLDEGRNGMYDKGDPDDEPLLRFDTYSLLANGEWEPIQDGSYCTAMPVGTDDKIMSKALEFIMNELHACVDSPKRMLEGFSWMNPNWFEEDN